MSVRMKKTYMLPAAAAAAADDDDDVAAAVAAAHGGRGAAVTLAPSVAYVYSGHATNAPASDVAPSPQMTSCPRFILLNHPHSSFQVGASPKLILTLYH